ncbi:MAG: hypothetical protein C0467_14855 [Planctomycetaceae bacterium]|nr:hypothetical protein [Planctomycetaceae bacterium]
MVVAPSAVAAENDTHAVVPERQRAFLQAHCQKCHDAKVQKGKFRVDDLPFAIANIETAERWQKVLNALNAGEMPPEDQKQPPCADKANFLDDLANVMVTARKSLGDQKGVVTMRRLNRREYRNTLRELLGVEINVSELPGDSGNGGFDTVGSNLFMSSNQFEQYLALGREALDEAFEKQTAAGVQKKLRFEVEDSLAPITKFVNTEKDAHDRGKKWVDAVMAAAAKPENKAVVAEIRKTAKDDAIFRRSWAKIAGAPSPESFGFDTGENNADKANRAANMGGIHSYYQYYLKLPALDQGAYLTLAQQDRVNSWLNLQVPFDWPVGNYTVRYRAAAVEGSDPQRRFMEFGINPRHGQVHATHEITGTMAAPQIIEIPWTLTRKHSDRSDRTLFIREKGTNDHIEQVRRKFAEGVKQNGVGPTVALWVDWFEIEYKPASAKPTAPGLAALGIPLDDKSKPPTAAEVRAAFERFAQEAFRGAKPTAGYIDRLQSLYDTRRTAGTKHSVALKESLAVVLASPMFLYLAEPASEKGRPLTDLELATRLSYFIWGAPPDTTLRDLATRGELSKPAVLAAETTRLLDDPRSAGFVNGFVYQWLGMDRLDFFEVNRGLFPNFDNATKLAARNEVYETFAYGLRENTSIRDLLKADHVIINSVLANYYGIKGVTGDAYRKVPVPKDSPRGGLLGMAAINLMGSNGERTSPVERGAWVLRKLLNDPPPPAPANVPAITRLAGKALTTRDRLQAHQDAPQCASCHRKIDPIGFGLENFDAVGQWRTQDSYQVMDASGKPARDVPKLTWTIDPSGAMHKGPAFKSYFELRDIIAGKSDAFARGFSEALVEYAIGRPVGFRDAALLDDMQRQVKAKDLAMREFIHALVRSKEFQTK